MELTKGTLAVEISWNVGTDLGRRVIFRVWEIVDQSPNTSKYLLHIANIVIMLRHKHLFLFSIVFMDEM